MCAAVLPYEPQPDRKSAAARALASIRQIGGVELTFRRGPYGTYAADVGERGGFRGMLPRTEHGAEAVLINTGGGIAGGDRVEHRISVAQQASAVVTTPSAERVYRTLGPRSEVHLSLDVADGGRLVWLPQETILYDGAALARRTDADVHPAARLTLLEAVMLGRQAMGESLKTGSLHDTWRVRRGGRLIFAEQVALSGAMAETMQRAAVGTGANAFATIAHFAPDANDLLEPVRSALRVPDVVSGASAWNGMLVVRLLSDTLSAIRERITRIAPILMARPLPRTWWT